MASSSRYPELNYDWLLNLGLEIRKLRLRRGWSQQQLADAMGITRQRVQALESQPAGKVETLERVAKALGYRMRIEFDEEQ